MLARGDGVATTARATQPTVAHGKQELAGFAGERSAEHNLSPGKKCAALLPVSLTCFSDSAASMRGTVTELGLALPTRTPARSRARRRAHTLAFVIAVWAVVAVNAGVITWLWLRGGGVSAVHTWGDLATSIGRLTGLLGAYFALVQVLLLARLPWLERLIGFDRLTVWHRRNGKLDAVPRSSPTSS